MPAQNNILISIVMATYNGDKFIEAQIDSILHQTYSNFELIICDDCSDDQTQAIVLSSAANASGIDLSFIHNVIIIEPFENYIYGKEIEKQLIGRVHRINQTHEVSVFRLIIAGTIEEEMYELL